VVGFFEAIECVSPQSKWLIFCWWSNYTKTNGLPKPKNCVKTKPKDQEATMTCSDKEIALREILGEARVETALRRTDTELASYMTNKEIFSAAELGLSALSLDAYLLRKAEGRAAARTQALSASTSLTPEALDLLIIAVCARHRLSRPQ
jgi:hypothetical protein